MSKNIFTMHYDTALILEMIKSAKSGSFASGIIGPLIIVSALYGYVETGYLVVWQLLHFTIYFVRLYLSSELLLAIENNEKFINVNLYRYITASALTGFMSGIVPWFSVAYSIPDINIFIIGSVIIALTAGSISTLGTVFIAFVSYMVFSIVPFSFGLLYHGGFIFDAFSFILIIYLVVHIMSGYRLFLVHKKSIELEQKFKTIYNKSSDGILIIKDNKVLDCNETMMRLFAYDDKEEFLKVGVLKFMPKFQPDGELSIKKMTSLLKQAKREKTSFEWFQLKKDGTTFWSEIILTPMELNSQNVIHGIWRDISEKKEDQETIEEKKVLLENSQHIAHLGNWEYNLLKKSLSWSDEIYNILELDAGVTPSYELFFSMLHPLDKERVELAYNKALQTQTSYLLEYRIVTHSGVTKFIKEQCETTLENNIVGVIQDVTTEKDLQRKSIERGKILDDSLNEIYIFDAENFKFLYINKGAQNNIGYSYKEMLNMTPMDIKIDMTKEDFSEVLKPISENSDEHIFFSTQHQRKDGTHYDADVYFQSTVFEGREALVAIILDVTNRKRAEKKIQEMNESLQEELQRQLEILREKDDQLMQQSKLAQMGDMVSMIAHQWRQPLNAIGASSINLSLLSTMGMLEDDKVQENSEFIQGQTQKMSQTINTFMNFVKPSKESAEFKLLEAVDSIIQIMGTQLANKNIEVKIVEKIEDVSIVGFKDLLEQVIINILSNARDAFEDKVRNNKYISIEIDVEDDLPTIHIEDNAGGIPQEVQDKIFNPYFTTKEQGKGTGIGLYMSIDIMRKSFSGDLKYSAIEDGSHFTIVCGNKNKVLN